MAKLLSVSNENGFKAKIELDVEAKDGTVSNKNKLNTHHTNNHTTKRTTHLTD